MSSHVAPFPCRFYLYVVFFRPRLWSPSSHTVCPPSYGDIKILSLFLVLISFLVCPIPRTTSATQSSALGRKIVSAKPSTFIAFLYTIPSPRRRAFVTSSDRLRPTFASRSVSVPSLTLSSPLISRPASLLRPF